MILLADSPQGPAAAFDAGLSVVLGRAVEVYQGTATMPPTDVDLGSAVARRSGVRSWVVLHRPLAKIEVRLRSYCPLHDPPSTASTCPALDEGVHDLPHRVPGCNCWCSGMAATLMRPAATVPVVVGLDLVVAHLERLSSVPFSSPRERACTWLSSAMATGETGFKLFCALVADGESPSRALAAASAIH